MILDVLNSLETNDDVEFLLALYRDLGYRTFYEMKTFSQVSALSMVYSSFVNIYTDNRICFLCQYVAAISLTASEVQDFLSLNKLSGKCIPMQVLIVNLCSLNPG